MAWLSSNSFVAGNAMSHAFLNNLANDIRAWGGDVNGGGFALTNAKVSLTAGTVALPSVAAATDPDTGLFWPSANVLGLAASGASRLRVGVEPLFTSLNISSVARFQASGANNAIVLDSGTAGPGYIYRALYWPFGSTSLSFSRFYSDPAGATSPIDDLVITSAGKVGINKAVPLSFLSVGGLATFADNTAATGGGLTAGDFYRTSTGSVQVVY